MKILYLVPHVPNPTKTRSYFQTRGLAEAGHVVTIATLARSPKDVENIRKLEAEGFQVISAPLGKAQSAVNSLKKLLSRQPLQAAFMRSDILQRKLEEHLSKNSPDVIHVEHLRMTTYGLRIPAKCPVIWDAIDHLATLFEQTAARSSSRVWKLLAWLESPRLCWYERWLTSQFPTTFVISKADQALFQRDNLYFERVKVTLHGLPLLPLSPLPRDPNTLILTGTLNYHPNVASALYFARQIFPIIHEHRPQTKLQLVGAHPTPELQALGGPHIEVTGFVPSLNAYLAKATVALAPILYGAGTKIKLLEAFNTGTPAVATTLAVSGLEVQNNEHLLIADSPQDFAAAVLRLLDDPDLQARLGDNGHRYIEENHDLTKTTAYLVEQYEEVIACHPLTH